MKPDLRTFIEVELLMAQIPDPYKVAEAVLRAMNKYHADQPETQDRIKAMEIGYDHAFGLTFKEREQAKAAERDAILKRKHGGR